MTSTKATMDPVCSMIVKSDDISLDYQGSHYVFCSNQCLERFQLNPHLYIGYPGSEAPKHAGKVALKKRTLKLSEPMPQEITDKAIDYIGSMMGIKNIEINGDRVDITYDLLEATELQIETALSEAGATLGDKWTEKLRRAFVHYTEEAETALLEAKPGNAHGHKH